MLLHCELGRYVTDLQGDPFFTIFVTTFADTLKPLSRYAIRRYTRCLQAIEYQNVEDADGLISDLWSYGTVGVHEDGHTLRAFFPDGLDLKSLLRPGATIYAVTDLAMPSASTTLLDPILAGNQFFIVPPQSTAATPPDRFRIEIDAQDAFGSGSHETTQLMITAMERILKPNHTFLDVGSGSGVLSSVAVQLKAHRVFACDTHLNAVRQTLLHAPSCLAFVGSVDALQNTCADVLAVNITSKMIDRLAPHLQRITKPNGWLLLSGFLEQEPPRSFCPQHVLSFNEWRCWLCRLEDQVLAQDPPSDSSLQPFAAEWW